MDVKDDVDEALDEAVREAQARLGMVPTGEPSMEVSYQQEPAEAPAEGAAAGCGQCGCAAAHAETKKRLDELQLLLLATFKLTLTNEAGRKHFLSDLRSIMPGLIAQHPELQQMGLQLDL